MKTAAAGVAQYSTVASAWICTSQRIIAATVRLSANAPVIHLYTDSAAGMTTAHSVRALLVCEIRTAPQI